MARTNVVTAAASGSDGALCGQVVALDRRSDVVVRGDSTW